MNQDGEFQSDLDEIRVLIRKYGWQEFENMVRVAGRSRKYPIY